MRPIKVGGRRVICPLCMRHYATAHVLGTITCGRCLRALFVGFMAGQNYPYVKFVSSTTSREKKVKE